MENYLVEREVLAQLVDAIIAQKYPDRPGSDFKELREASIKKLDDKIYQEIFGGLNEEQTKELQALLDDPNKNKQDYIDFFQKHHINLEDRIKKAAQDLSEELGGAE